MKEKIEEYLNSKKLLKEELKKWVINKDIPLEERWKTFITSGLGNEQGDYYSTNIVNVDSFLTNCNKFQTIPMEWFVEHFQQEEDDETITLLKEDILSNFVKSFDYDW